MANPLFAHLEPELLARQRQAIEVVEKVSTFGRLAAMVEADLEGRSGAGDTDDFRARPVNVDIVFGWADSREELPKVSGRVSTTLPMTCQRCLERCELELAVDIDLLLLPASDTRGADDALAVWELEDDRLRPVDVIEEMLIMQMPLAAMHADPADCGELAAPADEPAGDTVRPFADLKRKMERSG